MNKLKSLNPLKFNILSVFTLIFLLYGLFIAIYSIADFPSSLEGGYLPYLSDKPIGEDGFYMLKVAWNIANGQGITYSSGQLTTGVQPLTTFIYSLVAWINIHIFNSNKWLFLRNIIVLGTLSHILLAYLLAKLTVKLLEFKKSKTNLIFNISYAITLFSFGLFRLSTYGLETTFYLCGLCFLFTYLLDIFNNKKAINISHIIFTGIYSGFLILIRIDAILILLITASLLLIKKKLKIHQITYICLIASILSSPWFIYVYNLTGKFIPSSGGAQSSLIDSSKFLERLDPFIKALFSHSSSLFTIGRDFLFYGSLIIFIFLLILYFSNRRTRDNLILLFSNEIFNSIFLSIFALIALYFLTSEAKHFYYRYFSISILIFVPILSLILVEVPNLKSIYIFSLTLLIFSGQAFGSLHSGTIHNSHAVTAGYINSNFQRESDLIGAFQSGVIGFFNNGVFCLDGKLDHEALGYLGGSTLSDLKNNNIIEYISKKKINVIVDWDIWIRRLAGELIEDPKSDWRECQKPINNKHGNIRSICITREAY